MRRREINRRKEIVEILLPNDTKNEFFRLDYDLCIRCGKCVKAVDQVQLCDAMTIDRNSIIPYPIPKNAISFEDAGCVGCGNCITVCPTDALIPNSQIPYVGREYNEKRTMTVCTYCGVGCQLELVVDEDKNRIVYVDAKKSSAVNGKMTCVKGKFGWDYIHHDDRISTPYIRKNGELVPASWNEAYDLIESRLRSIHSEFGGDAMTFLTSAKMTNEENYLMNKLARGVFKTNNIDHCARLCHASTVTGLVKTFGSGAMTNSIEDLTNDAEVIFIIGSNTTEAHPVIGAKIKQSVAKGKTKLIVADPREIELSEYAEIYIQHKPGTDLAIINAMLKIVLEEHLIDEEFINERTEGFSELKNTLLNQDIELLCKLAGVTVDKVRDAARLYAKAGTAAIVYAMGITQHFTGTYNVAGLANLAMMTGNVGKPGTGVNPLRGQNNVQGACDLGGLPDVYTGYQKVHLAENKAKFEKFWNVEGLNSKPGLTLTEMMNAAYDGTVKSMYIVGENPVLTDPDINKVKKALSNLDFLIVQDLFMTETAEFADVLLPAVSFAEKDGTFTNTERRIQRVRKAIIPNGESRADWQILNDLLIRFGFNIKYNSPSDIMEEIRACTPIYGGITYERIDEVGLAWPCRTLEDEGTKILHTNGFSRGKGKFIASEFVPADEMPDAEYPYVLTTGRSLYHWHSGVMTRRSEGLHERKPVETSELNPVDAEKLGIKNGDRIRVSSRRGTLETIAKVTDKILPGLLFMTFHFKESAANLLTNTALDPFAKIPELKVAAIKIEKIEPLIAAD